MRLVNILGGTTVQHPEHGQAEAGSDGVFNLSEPFGQALLAHAAQWRTEADHVALLAQQRLRELADPKRAAEVLDFVHGRVRDLEGEVAALRAELDERITALEDGAQQPPADVAPPEPKAAGKKTTNQ